MTLKEWLAYLGQASKLISGKNHSRGMVLTLAPRTLANITKVGIVLLTKNASKREQDAEIIKSLSTGR